MFKNGAYYNGIGPVLKEHFGKRTVKAAIDGGFTCPNRDGTLGTGGCIFCSEQGSGDFTGEKALTDKEFSHFISNFMQDKLAFSPDPVSNSSITHRGSITRQIDAQILAMHRKWHDFACIAYFQNYTNTYAPLSELKSKFEEALAHPECAGLAIATRPDCLNEDVLDYLEELNKKTFLWIETGLQTSNDKTAAIINRCCSLSTYDDSVDRLINRGIRVVTHIIFGLPGETREDMLQSISHVCSKQIFGIKIQLLHIIKGTVLGNMYELQNGRNNDFIKPLEKDEYINLVTDALEIIPPDITIHRLTGDAPRALLLAPQWSLDKKSVLNGINMELKRRGSCQGMYAHKHNNAQK